MQFSTVQCCTHLYNFVVTSNLYWNQFDFHCVPSSNVSAILSNAFSYVSLVDKARFLSPSLARPV